VSNSVSEKPDKRSTLTAAIDAIREHAPFEPEIAVVLGSGLGGFTESLSCNAAIQTASIPGYPRSTVEGHKGELVFCTASGRRLLAFRGRVHFFESGDVNALLFPIRVAAALGARILIITNAAGGVNRTFVPGDLMLISDQIDLTGESCPEPGGSKSRGAPYDQQLIRMAENTADKIGVRVVRGVYAGVKGPSYETAAEIEMINRIGGDAVGMSTVLEVALASSLGMRVLGISCITNKATGTSSAKLNHEEVTVVANQVREQFSRLLTQVIKALPSV
jgi:purine-nucleoside phosphorylase